MSHLGVAKEANTYSDLPDTTGISDENTLRQGAQGSQ